MDARQLFRQEFGHPPTHVVRAPGRVELLGNHTDYNEGLVLALAVDRVTEVAVSARTDGRIVARSSAFERAETFSVLDETRGAPPAWTDYLKGTLLALRRRQVHATGMNVAVHSTIPLGAGLSSSAALMVGFALAVRELKPFTLTSTGATVPPQRDDHDRLPPLLKAEKIELARVCHAAESGFVGVNCGLLDPLSSLFGKAFHAIEIDCQSLAIEPVPMLGEVAIVLCDSGVKHSHVGGEYNSLRAGCEAAARALGVKSLRAVDVPWLAANRTRLSEREHQCAYHIVGENQRVVAGARALRDGDFAQFGQFLLQSHESSRDHFWNSCAELDLLVDLARQHPGCLGARLTGGGFGGATINLVRRGQMESFSHAMAAVFERRTGRALKPMVCQIVDGAGSGMTNGQ